MQGTFRSRSAPPPLVKFYGTLFSFSIIKFSHLFTQVFIVASFYYHHILQQIISRTPMQNVECFCMQLDNFYIIRQSRLCNPLKCHILFYASIKALFLAAAPVFAHNTPSAPLPGRKAQPFPKVQIMVHKKSPPCILQSGDWILLRQRLFTVLLNGEACRWQRVPVPP